MASGLSSTGVKSGFLYLILLIAIVMAVLYFLLVQRPGVRDNMDRHAFRLNFAAFSNGIKFANLRYTTNSASVMGKGGIDQWLDGDIGLDYNNAGFPIGTDILVAGLQLPRSSKDCLQLWQFVLGPLQPKITLSQKSGKYWTRLIDDSVCIYQSSQIDGLFILYDANKGKVSLNGLN